MKKKKAKKKSGCCKKKGFTLLEVLLVVAAIAILAGIVILAINPNKQLAETRNDQRRSDVNTIMNAVYQYYIDTGSLPANIASTGACSAAANEICKIGGDCTTAGITDISELTTNGKYIVSIPFDPNGSSTDGTGYGIVKDTNNRVTVCAPHAEQSATISIKK